MHDEKHAIVQGVIVWDGITRPETDTPNGKPKHSVKIVIAPNHPDVALLEAMAQKELREGEFKGNLPNGGQMPIGTASPSEFNGLFPGYRVISVGTYNGQPQVFDMNGAPVNSMALSSQVYNGAVINVLCHAYTYNNKSRGIAFGLDGIQIVDATRPKLSIGGGIDAAKAFGKGGPTPQQYDTYAQTAGAPVPAPAAPVPTPAAPAHDFLNPVPPPAPTEPSYNVGGTVYTHSQLLGFGRNEAQIATAQRVS
jgi:hypothetical protein